MSCGKAQRPGGVANSGLPGFDGIASAQGLRGRSIELRGADSWPDARRQVWCQFVLRFAASSCGLLQAALRQVLGNAAHCGLRRPVFYRTEIRAWNGDSNMCGINHLARAVSRHQPLTDIPARSQPARNSLQRAVETRSWAQTTSAFDSQRHPPKPDTRHVMDLGGAGVTASRSPSEHAASSRSRKSSEAIHRRDFVPRDP